MIQGGNADGLHLLHGHAPAVWCRHSRTQRALLYYLPSSLHQAKFEAYARSASDVATQQWGGQPGNFELMVKQG